MSIWGALLLLNRFKVNNLWPYLAGGIAMWYFMLHSGVHATITGVLLAFAIPFRDGSDRSPSHLLQHALHKPVAFIILPLFALANTALSMDGLWYQHLGDSNSLGILAGLALGKPLGIFIFSFVAVSTGLCALPQGIGWKQVLGIGFLGGIGFTMSIFITLLAFDHAERIDQSKVAILCSSLLSAVMGFAWLYFILDQRQSIDSLAHH
jgi:NhaA family Na+:H+ antiporter